MKADDPLPYLPIRIVDVSPYRTDLWQPRPQPRSASRRRLPRRIALLAGMAARP